MKAPAVIPLGPSCFVTPAACPLPSKPDLISLPIGTTRLASIYVSDV